ncbi:MAG: hypothetical protein HFJ10_05360 [Lachnospiraceae bacterium]|jgi:hypothetical protein|nr:hypothetical protein [Lachnospiraceae bacterium]
MQEEKYIGPKLTEAHADMGKIIFQTSLRILLAGVIIVAGIRGNPPKGGPVNLLAGIIVTLIILGAAVWVFFPLKHCKDFMAFHENGIVFCKRAWTLKELGNISFVDSKSNRALFTRTYMRTQAKVFDITYIKDGKKNFNRAYYNFI